MDCAAPDPFLPVKIVSTGTRHMTGPSGVVKLEVCDIEIKPGLMAAGIPRDYLIEPSELGAWADRIAAWFMDYPAKIRQGAQHEAQTDTK